MVFNATFNNIPVISWPKIRYNNIIYNEIVIYT